MIKLKFEYRITLAYLLLGGAWILLSDSFVNSFDMNSHLQSQIQTYKGWFYVIITAVIFFIFIKRHLKKLRKAEQDALDSDRLKSAFLANISHEIRTPMNGIIGFAEILRNSQLTGKQQREYLKVIESSSERLLSLINDLMLLSRIDAGQIGLENSDVNINWVLESVSDYSMSDAEKKGLGISVFKSLPDSDSVIDADEGKLRAVIQHLVNNAIKYSIRGTIELGYTRKEQVVEFYVKDQGIGIPTMQQKIIFDRFVQADSRLSNAYQGAGIGLSIAKSLIEMMGGKIWVESQEGAGSKFYFTIPLHR